MYNVARFTIGPGSHLGPARILGATNGLNKTDLLKTGVIYEIVESMGTLMVRPVGESAIGATQETSDIPASWEDSPDKIICYPFYMTKAEVADPAQTRRGITD